MRRRRKKRNPLSVSLFPFLAVLICTFGVLIVMLVMAVKSADDQATMAQSENDAEKLARIAELQDELGLRELQIQGMESVRPDAVERLNQSRANRSYLEDEIRKLNREYKRVGEQLLALDSQAKPDASQLEQFSQVEADQSLRALKQNIVDAKSELAKKRESAAQAGPSTYVIVPHKGGGGTFRRPIYIECTRDAITLQPSGIRFSKDEFVLPLDPGNMLDSALLANREYWQRYDLAGDQGSPYPLIIVRPGGAETFVIARRAMKSWDDEFGYELVESDKQLDFGTSDSQLNAEMNDAITEARRRQRAKMVLLAANQKRAARFASQTSRPGLTASGRSGGFVSSAGEGGTGPRSSEESLYQSQHSEPDQGQFEGDPDSSSARDTNSKTKNGVGGDLDMQNPNQDLSLAQQRGANWALPTKTAGATGYVRPIRLFCGPDFLEIKSAGGRAKRIPISKGTQSAIDPLVEQIWQQIDSWGISGANSFWKPQLRVTILPGGTTRFQELKGLLHQSGLSVEEFNE